MGAPKVKTDKFQPFSSIPPPQSAIVEGHFPDHGMPEMHRHGSTAQQQPIRTSGASRQTRTPVPSVHRSSATDVEVEGIPYLPERLPGGDRVWSAEFAGEPEETDADPIPRHGSAHSHGQKHRFGPRSAFDSSPNHDIGRAPSYGQMISRVSFAFLPMSSQRNFLVSRSLRQRCFREETTTTTIERNHATPQASIMGR